MSFETSGTTFRPSIYVERDVLPIAIRHGMELWWDGSTPTHRLDQRGGRNGFTRFVNARIEGKIAEVAFSQFLETFYDIESGVDWRIYGDYEITDDGDLQYLVGRDGEQYPPAVEFDLKKTKPYNQWLAIRSSIHSSIPDEAPIVLAKCHIPDDIELSEFEDADTWIDVDGNELFRNRLLSFAEENFPIEVEMVGTAYPPEFTDHFDQGERLYDNTSGAYIGPELRRDNEGINVEDLRNSYERWDQVVDDIVGNHPIDYEPMLSKEN